jgi:hypothetical protein
VQRRADFALDKLEKVLSHERAQSLATRCTRLLTTERSAVVSVLYRYQGTDETAGRIGKREESIILRPTPVNIDAGYYR